MDCKRVIFLEEPEPPPLMNISRLKRCISISEDQQDQFYKSVNDPQTTESNKNNNKEQSKTDQNEKVVRFYMPSNDFSKSPDEFEIVD